MEYRLRTMSLGDMLDAAFNVFKNDFWLLCAIVGVVLFLPQFVLNLFPLYLQQMDVRPGDEEMMMVVGLLFLGVWLVSWLAMVVLGPFANAAVMKVVADRYLGNPTSFGSAYRYVFRRFWKLVSAVLLSGMLVVAGTFCCVVPGILLLLHYFVVSAVVVVEDVGGWPAMQRSGELMKGNWGKAFVLWILVAFLGGTVGGMSGLVPQFWVRGLFQSTFNVVSTAFLQVMVTMVYLHARCEKEGFDLERLATSLGERYEVQAADGPPSAGALIP